MTYFAPVANIELLLELQAINMLGSSVLVLAHDVVANPQPYIKFRDKYKGSIILDNSLIELGEPVSSGIMREASEMVMPEYTVLPDILLDSERTIRMSCAAYEEWHKIGVQGKPMIVAQGRSVQECVSCVETIADNCNMIDYRPSVPRILVKEIGSRGDVVREFGNRDIPVHLLGMSVDFVDDILTARLSNVMGIDSATPIRLGWEQITLTRPSFKVNPADELVASRDDFFKYCTVTNRHIIYNLGYMTAIINQ